MELDLRLGVASGQLRVLLGLFPHSVLGGAVGPAWPEDTDLALGSCAQGLREMTLAGL